MVFSGFVKTQTLWWSWNKNEIGQKNGNLRSSTKSNLSAKTYKNILNQSQRDTGCFTVKVYSGWCYNIVTVTALSLLNSQTQSN